MILGMPALFFWILFAAIYTIIGSVFGTFLHYRVGGDMSLEESPAALFLGALWPLACPIAIGIVLGTVLFKKGS